MNKNQKQYFIMVLRVDSWEWQISHNKHRVCKDFPEPALHESFKATGAIIYSDLPKHKKDTPLKIWLSTDYKYTIYNLLKNIRFVDDSQPDSPFASISYDEYIERQEEKPNQSVGSIDRGEVYATIPAEIATRIVTHRNQPLYIDVMAHKVPNRRILLITSLGFSNSFTPANYE